MLKHCIYCSNNKPIDEMITGKMCRSCKNEVARIIYRFKKLGIQIS